ncbi:MULTISPECIES: glycosyltransferase family 2 protein [Leptospirillum]|jgi:glycosyltransferase involved in cell wall biosynthesis|uniref:glycosyltransferase family 2 protein n=1 Tax=Leptospirillum TaxID=179 RepID=UPI0000F0CF46|nr:MULTISPECIES: glycosyltransferase family 2 protein [Leptospirillum]AKS23604.1 bactoprenol glucosyl transferase [Leptospirillum sp. Group II 'CF-1']EAY56215.1 MAG: putative glycosyl transferase, family 2 [Leptospirillum rubarum]EIJ75432.1 MAG: Putative glycosyl transferase, family 2 [Leptospirillum sp. Group II 'C75']OOH81609.1 glycosyltransferase [Leptospirillum ferriphilum]
MKTENLENSGENRDQSALVIVSIVIPFYNEADLVVPVYERLSLVLDSLKKTWEIVCVNDGSQDGTLQKLLTIRKNDKRLKILDLSRNFGKESALTAGLDHVRGIVTIPMDADLQDPPELIPILLSKWEEGYDIVNAVRIVRDGESWFKKLTAYGFYRLFNLFSHVKIPEDVGDFRLISKPALDAIKSFPERRRFMKGIFAWVGFRTTTVHYERDRRLKGKSKWSYWRLWNLALEGITSFSQIPLHISSYIGFFVSFGSICYGIFLLLRTLLFGNPVKGYPSLIVAVLFLGGVQLMALGVIGEYLGRTYEESKQRPRYIIRSQWMSD